MAKRGRKRKGYFYEEQEQAVIDYITIKDIQKKNEIFDKWLRPAFTKMIESIIRTYKLFVPNEEFEQTFNDTMSFMLIKMEEKYDPSKGRAYSYCGTICKRFLFQKLDKCKVTQKRQESYELIHEALTDTIRYAEEMSNNANEDLLTQLIDKTCKKINEIIEDKNTPLKDDEKKVGEALIYLFQHWDEIFNDDERGSNKFNKSNILRYLKETTRLKTPAIRNNMKKYKAAYYDIKKMLIEM